MFSYHSTPPSCLFDWVCSPASEDPCDLFPLFYVHFFFHLPLVSAPEGSLLPVQRRLDVRRHPGLFVGCFITESLMITQSSRFIRQHVPRERVLLVSLPPRDLPGSQRPLDSENAADITVIYLTAFQVRAILFHLVGRARTPSRYIWLRFTGGTGNAYIQKNCDCL